jgi:hypothetical protein
MTEQEVEKWIGVPPGYKVNPVIVAGMADVKNPETDEEHIAAFTAFLKVAGPAPKIARMIRDRRTPNCDHAVDDGCLWCCEDCNWDRHLCPGCGAVGNHKNQTCAEDAKR